MEIDERAPVLSISKERQILYDDQKLPLTRIYIYFNAQTKKLKYGEWNFRLFFMGEKGYDNINTLARLYQAAWGKLQEIGAIRNSVVYLTQGLTGSIPGPSTSVRNRVREQAIEMERTDDVVMWGATPRILDLWNRDIAVAKKNVFMFLTL